MTAMTSDDTSTAAARALDQAVSANDLGSTRAALEQDSRIAPLSGSSRHYTDDATSLRSRAASQGKLEMLKLLSLPKYTAHFSSDEAAADEQLCLRHAAQHGHLEIIKYLLDATKSSADDKKALYSLMLLEAASAGHVPIVRYNLEHGADPHIKNSISEEPLSLACSHGHTEVVQVMLEAGVPPSSPAPYGRPSYNDLWRAAAGGHLDIMRLLLEHGADERVGEISVGAMAMRGAAEKGQVSAMELLFEHGVDMSGRLGSSAALSALQQGHVDALRLLAKHGVDLPSLVNNASVHERDHFASLAEMAMEDSAYEEEE